MSENLRGKIFDRNYKKKRAKAKKLSGQFNSGVAALLSMKIDTGSVKSSLDKGKKIHKEIDRKRDSKLRAKISSKAQQNGQDIIDFLGKGIFWLLKKKVSSKKTANLPRRSKDIKVNYYPGEEQRRNSLEWTQNQKCVSKHCTSI